MSVIIASSSTFNPHLMGMVIRDMFRLLPSVLHSTEEFNLQQLSE